MVASGAQAREIVKNNFGGSGLAGNVRQRRALFCRKDLSRFTSRASPSPLRPRESDATLAHRMEKG